MAGFRRWRRQRPFWGGLFLILSALELLLSANMNLNGIEVRLGPQGFLSYLLPVLLLTCGLLSWFTPAQRLFYGIVALLTALYTFVGLNLGGFFVGMLLGIVGGALLIAWGPPRPPRDEAAAQRPASPPASSPPVSSPAASSPAASSRPVSSRPVSSPPASPPPVSPYGTLDDVRITGHAPPDRPPRGNPKAFVIALLAVAVTAGVLVAGSRTPAGAAECPEGLPSRSSTPAELLSPSLGPSPSSSSRSPSSPAPPRHSRSTSPSPSASPIPSPSPSEERGNPVVEGVVDFFDGVGDLLGIGGRKSPSPSASPTQQTTTPTATRAPTAAPAVSSPPALSSPPSGSSSASPSTPGARDPRPVLSGPEIPCLGARLFNKVAGADDIPQVSAKPGLMEVDSLTMYNPTYDGVVDMPTEQGSFKALKFSMDRAVNKPFSLTIDEAGTASTVVRSNKLTTAGAVRFYTPEFKGKLFGLIPVTFTPERPPPLTLPVLWFTDVTIKLAYVRCDVLTADPMRLTSRLG